jgi:hypothetical protein
VGAGGATAAWGIVRLSHLQQLGAYEYEQLSLQAAFYAEDYDPEESAWGFVETRETPDGVPCDIYYQSGMEDPPPAPPAEIDAGGLTAGSGAELLAITFDGAHYGVDYRSPTDPDHPMPSWLAPEPLTLSFTGSGSALVASFVEDATLPTAARIVAPTPEQSPVPQEPDGTHLIAWEPSEAQETLVRLQFNLDWDNSMFWCRPPSGVTELRLPHEWLTEWTWGSGELAVDSRSATDFVAGAAEVRLLPSRVVQQSVSFEVW